MSITQDVQRAIHRAATDNRGIVYRDYGPEAEAAIVAVIDHLMGEAGERVVVSDRDDHVADGVDLSDWLADYTETT